MSIIVDPVSDLPLLDFSQVKNLIDLEGEAGKISGILHEMIDATRLNFRDLKKAAKGGDLHGVVHASHKLVGGSGYLGLVRMRALAQLIEKAAKDGDMETALGCLEPFTMAYAAGFAALDDALASCVTATG
jgi:HPt (histidine-containing phosphotransfer) domain-containing protein